MPVTGFLIIFVSRTLPKRWNKEEISSSEQNLERSPMKTVAFDIIQPEATSPMLLVLVKYRDFIEPLMDTVVISPGQCGSRLIILTCLRRVKQCIFLDRQSSYLGGICDRHQSFECQRSRIGRTAGFYRKVGGTNLLLLCPPDPAPKFSVFSPQYRYR